MRNVFLPSQRVPRVGVRACLSAFSRPASQGGLGHASQHFTPTLTVLSPSGGRTFANLEGRDAASTWARHDTSEPLSPPPSSSERPTPIAIRQHHGKHWHTVAGSGSAGSRSRRSDGIRAGERFIPAPRAPAAIAHRFFRSASLAIRVFFRMWEQRSAAPYPLLLEPEATGPEASGVSAPFASTSVCVRSDFTRMLRTH